MILKVTTETGLLPAAEKLLAAYPGRRVFAFYGKMGAGKTTFIKAISSVLGAVDVVQSPSFPIINEYKTSTGDSIFHFDFYRIRKTEEVFDIGYEEYIYSGSYCFIEWPELMEDLLPDDVVKVKIRGKDQRQIEF
ncbi:MAG TPA: tRNA (adenosine(37)-N6)-threonylcarbamoyltransferase complex ATPase subunit type 1 TsaE [Bacteroidales bacterium]|nr:tRNA (adenosine(37)-N6)-threonylcarbamoyltransferase complex ATPase subunit type 1 TsaE [Bacteroidales bacterium]